MFLIFSPRFFLSEKRNSLKSDIKITRRELVEKHKRWCVNEFSVHTISILLRYDKQAKLLEDFKFWKDKMTEKLSEADQMLVQFQVGFTYGL